MPAQDADELTFLVPVRRPPASDQTVAEWLEEEMMRARDPKGPGGILHLPQFENIVAIRLMNRTSQATRPINSRMDPQTILQEIMQRMAQETEDKSSSDSSAGPGVENYYRPWP